MKNFLKYLSKLAIFWFLYFAFHRLVFIVYNYSYADGASVVSMLSSFAVGFRLDLSMSGYVLMLTAVLQAICILVTQRFAYKHLHWTNYFFIGGFTILMLSNTNLYSYWGRHLDAEALSFVKTPGVILTSLTWWQIILFFIATVSFVFGSVMIYRKYVKSIIAVKKLRIGTSFLAAFITLFLAALMIIPIRGSFGVAPINTGVAYFSKHMYANHAAVNPLWNLFYSFKRMDARTRHYKFMDEEKAMEVFNDMTLTTGETHNLLNNQRPNIVVILLESFSSQVIGALSGGQATPNFDNLVAEGILFSNIYAASDRSDKGLVATLAGYQVMPGYSIIQYPAKSQSLNFLPLVLRENGYDNMTYMYGGDIGFKGMNSFVTLAGFDEVITISDFPRSTHGQKWGVHDEFTFDKLVEEMKKATHPYFKFYFTLSSHEPFDVPMQKVLDDPYLNSVYYTDKCLGDFFNQVKDNNLWDNTLFILIADHGVPGAARATSQMRERYQIPMLWTGGAVNSKDTIIHTLGSQTDLVATLLNQLNIDDEDFKFSKNLLDSNVNEFAFFTYSDAFGMVTPESFHVYDNRAKRLVAAEGNFSGNDSIMSKAYLQVLSADHLSR